MTRTFYDRNAFKILLLAALCLGPTLVGALRTLKSNKNDVADWLPDQYPETKTFKWFRKHFANEQFILASWDGCTLDDQRLKLMTGKLAPPVPVEQPPAELPAAPGARSLSQNRQAGGTPAPQGGFGIGAKAPRADQPTPRYFKDDVVTGKMLLEHLTSDQIKLGDEEALERLKGTLIGADGKTTCIVLTLSDEGKRHLREAVKTVRRVATQECAIPLETLHLGGPPVDNVAIDEAGEQSLYRLAGLAAVIGLVVSWWCLRSARLIALVFASGIYGAAASLAIVWWSPLALGHAPGWVSMNAILLTMPSLVYVATISGAIHLSNYYRDELAEGHALAGAPERAIKHAALPLTLATVTTAVGLLTLCYSELVPIVLFGFYSALGVIVSMLLLFFYLPACFQVWAGAFAAEAAAKARAHDAAQAADAPRSLGDIAGAPIWRGAGQWVIRRHGLVAAGCLCVLAICMYGTTKIQTSVHLMKLFPPDAKILADYQWLEHNLGDLVPMEVVLRLDQEHCHLDFLQRMELVERVQARLAGIPDVGGVLSAVTFAPHLPRPEEYKDKGGLGGAIGRLAGVRNRYTLVRKQFNKYLEEHRDDFIQGDYLSEENGNDLWRISARVGALKDVDFGDLLVAIKAHVDPAIDAERAGGVEGLEVVYTGLVPLVYKAQQSLLQGLIWGFISDFILITIVMMVAVRDWSAGLILALPSIFPAAVVFGVMGLMGIVVDIGTVMAPSVALGVTVDDVVHFMIQYRGGLKLGLNRRDSVMLAYKGCATAMYQSWGVIGLGLSVFALSRFTPTQRFGYMMVTLLTSALVGNLLLLPALLASPLGGLFGRRFTRNRPVSPTSAPPPHEAGRPGAARGGIRENSEASVRIHSAEQLAREHARRGLP
ncbi:MAG TPA: MMPL family transporter [Pirellulales bacterium]|nr:MMPL family transporter [Pirellulales bacterium]